jgi:hypothetical protein
MIDNHDLCERTFRFACDVSKLCTRLQERGAVVRRLSMKLLDAGTSIGANIEEGRAGQSKPDFIAKNFISLKEFARNAVLASGHQRHRPSTRKRTQAVTSGGERIRRHADDHIEKRPPISVSGIAEFAVNGLGDVAVSVTARRASLFVFPSSFFVSLSLFVFRYAFFLTIP